jgi:hypothetical protein
MPFALVDDVRELARRSRRTQRAGLGAVVVSLLAAPVALAFGPWAALAMVVAGGVLLLAFARFAGQERGAYRALLRAMKAKPRDQG